MKITLKHLAPYLPYGLKAKNTDSSDQKGKEWMGIKTIIGLHDETVIQSLNNFPYMIKFHIDKIKPILRPLSDYTDITSKSMSDLDCDLTDQMDIQEFALKKMSLSSLLYSSFDVLTRNHVDIFGLIPEGLAIDINTL